MPSLPAKIHVQKDTLKKERKGMLIPFQGQKISKIPSPAYLLLSRLKSGSGRRPLKKREKRNVSNIPKIKNEQNYLFQLTFHNPSRNPSPVRRSLKKKKKKER